MLDVQEYAKQKGIPVGTIPVHAFRKAQETPITIRLLDDSKAEAFKKLCTDTKDLLQQCTASAGVSFVKKCLWNSYNYVIYGFCVVLLDVLTFITVVFTKFCLPQTNSSFPETCVDLGIKHMECLVNKREKAMEVAIKLAGKEKCEKVFPYYEDSKDKAMELIDVYKSNVEGGKRKKDAFWG